MDYPSYRAYMEDSLSHLDDLLSRLIAHYSRRSPICPITLFTFMSLKRKKTQRALEFLRLIPCALKIVFFNRLFFSFLFSNIEQLFNVMPILCNVDSLVILLILSAIFMCVLLLQHIPLLKKKTIKTLVLLLFQQLQLLYAIYN